jgi:hypothetical protein
MCSPLAWVHALAIAGIVFAFIAGALLDGKLQSHFQQRHPEVWADLGQRKLRFVDGDMQGAAMHQYLWRGEHKRLQDAELNSMFFKYWLLAALFLGSTVAVILVQDWVSTATYLACLGLL